MYDESLEDAIADASAGPLKHLLGLLLKVCVVENTTISTNRLLDFARQSYLAFEVTLPF